jgi:hypothetical protein
MGTFQKLDGLISYEAQQNDLTVESDKNAGKHFCTAFG